ncbi:MAG: PepSY domain-containing protein [Sulfuritalea sp.]|nr:PepSY domain-containing protein [Sulfuritalea sp.]
MNLPFIRRSSLRGYNQDCRNQESGLDLMSNLFSRRRWRTPFLALCAVLLACGSGAGRAGDGHDRARQALEAGEVLPLRAILERVEREYPGQVIDVELEREHESGRERWVYEVKVLRSGGSLVKLKVDARDGTILGGKDQGKPRSKSVQPKTHPIGDGR